LLKDTSSARCAEVRTATMTQTMATATITPIGTTRLVRAWSHRDRLLSPAICDRAEGTTLPPIGQIAARTIGSKDCE